MTLASLRQRFPTDPEASMPWETVWAHDNDVCPSDEADDINLLQIKATAERLTVGSVGLAYGGHLCSRVDGAAHAFLGEHSALIWALCWPLRCSDWSQQVGTAHLVQFRFYFDATTTGMQAAGTWRTSRYQSWRCLMRALVHVLHERHSPGALWWQHVKAHNDHPWNELVDRLAKFASTAGDLGPNCDPWHSWLHQPEMLTPVQWIWYLEHVTRHSSLTLALNIKSIFDNLKHCSSMTTHVVLCGHTGLSTLLCAWPRSTF